MELLFAVIFWISWLISWICLITGSLFAIIGGVGILRLPDFYTRLHAGGITDTMGAGLIMLGLMFQAASAGVIRGELGLLLVTVKLVMILFFLLITSPTSCHALAHAAWTHGQEPVSFDQEEGTAEG